MTTTDTTQLEYWKDRVDRFTAKAYEAEQRYIVLFDDPRATQTDLDFARWEYRQCLEMLGKAMNKFLNAQYNLQRGIDKRMRRAA